MSIRRLHIRIQQELQRYDAAREMEFLPEHIDIAINKQLFRYVKEKYSLLSNRKLQGIESSRKRVADLEPLLKYYVPVLTYKTENLPEYAVAFDLPSDLMILENMAAQVEYHKNLIPIETFKQTTTRYVAKIRFKTVGYDNPSISLSEIGEDFSSNFKSEMNQLDVTKDSELFLRNLIQYFNEELQIDAYWENYKSINEPNHILLVTPDSTLTNVIMNWGDEIQSEGEFQSVTYSTISSDQELRNTLSPVSYMKADEDVSTLSNKFFTTFYSSPNCNVNQGRGIVYYNDNFIVKDMKLNYIKYPTMVSYNRDISTELDISSDEELISNVVLDLLEVSQSERFETKSHLNQNKE